MRSDLTALPAVPGGGEQLDLFFDLAVDLLAVAGLDGCFHRMSASVTGILGYRVEEVVGRAFLELVSMSERERVWLVFARLAKGEIVRDFETEFLHRDGTYRWLSWNASAPVGDGMTYMAGRDITAGREAERKLRASEERFHLAVNGTSDGLWDWTDVRASRAWWSPRMYELLGMEDGEIAASSDAFMGALHPEDRPAGAQMLQNHFERGLPFDLTCRLRTKQGPYRRFRIRGAATRDESGAPVRMAGTVSDVTEALETLDRLKRSEQLLRATGALARVGGWEVDAATLQPNWSPEVAHIHGFPAGAQPDLNRCLALHPPEDRPRIMTAMNRALRHGTPWNLELPLVTADGRPIWVHSQGRAETENGRVTRLYGAVQDITERKESEQRMSQTLAEVQESRARSENQAIQLAKQAAELALARESAEEAARLKSSFLATMSHEIRTPMNGVLGMVSLLEGTALSNEQREYLDTIRVSGESLLEIINDVLDFSKTEAGKTRFTSTPFELARCCEDAADMLAARAAARKLDLSVFVSPACPLELRGDPGRLRQVLVNLIGNALKFTEVGQVTLRVEPAPGQQSWLRFEVSDSGIGIARNVLPHLFQPFMQADSGTTRRFGGTGLGLAICKQIVEAAGGRIGALSEPGRGATFWFELNLPVVAPPSLSGPAELRGAPIAILARSPALRTTLEHYLAGWGAQPSTFDSLAAAGRALGAGGRIPLIVVETGGPFGFPVAEAAELSRLRSPRLAVAIWPGSKEIEEARELHLDTLFRPIKRGRLLAWATGHAARPEAAAAGPNPLGGLRVLVAEDNPVNQRIVLKMLERLGHDATIAVNGREALERIRAESFDLILMDCQMPEMDGFQAAREIRRRCATPPIVALTANALEGDRQRCLDAGMDDYLLKPIDLAALTAMVERWRRPAPVGDSV